MRKNAPMFYNAGNFFSNVKQALKKVRLNSWRTNVLYYCKRLLMESHRSFDKILTHYLSSFMENVLDLLPRLDFFRKHKRGPKVSEGYFM